MSPVPNRVLGSCVVAEGELMDQLETQRLSANRANWDARAVVHAASDFYDIDRYVRDRAFVSPIVRDDHLIVGDVTGRSLLHLQCHIGTDTISWARLGAHATGLDFSPSSLAVARDLSSRCAAPVTYVEGNVLDAPSVLERRFDVVYASIGVLPWIPSVSSWAKAAAACLEPGGTLYLRDGHPYNSTFDYERDDELLVAVGPYFQREGPQRSDEPWTYTDGPGVHAAENYQWAHGLGEAITAFIDAGLVIQRVDEQDSIPWQALPWLVRDGAGEYRMPADRPAMPLTFSILATSPS